MGEQEEKKRSLICRLRPPGTERLSDLPGGPTETRQGGEKGRAPDSSSSELSSAPSDNLVAGKTVLLRRGSIPAAPCYSQEIDARLISTSPRAPAQQEAGRLERHLDPQQPVITGFHSTSLSIDDRMLDTEKPQVIKLPMDEKNHEPTR